jgi:hypothetical protein
MTTALSISADFESGNIEVVEIDGHHAKLRIRNDTGHPSIKQWFYFKATGRQGTVYTYTILNARGASYPRTLPEVLPDPLWSLRCTSIIAIPVWTYIRSYNILECMLMAESRPSRPASVSAALPLFVPILF